MKPLLVLIGVFAIGLFATMPITDWADLSLAGRIAMAVMLVFTAIGHFAFVDGMAMMMPEIFPLKRQIVYLTGVIEVAAAAGLLVPSLVHLTGWLLIAFFVCVLPANINAAMKNVDFQKATNDGSGPGYLLFRMPLQIFFIAWVWVFAIHFYRQ